MAYSGSTQPAVRAAEAVAVACLVVRADADSDRVLARVSGTFGRRRSAHPAETSQPATPRDDG